MNQGRYLSHKPASMRLRILLLCMAMLLSNTVAAGKSFLVNPDINDLKDGSVLLAPVGRRDAAIRMLFQTSGSSISAREMNNNGMSFANKSSPEVFLSMVIPW